MKLMEMTYVEDLVGQGEGPSVEFKTDKVLR